MICIYVLRMPIKLNIGHFRHKGQLICLFNKATVFCMTYELNSFKIWPFLDELHVKRDYLVLQLQCSWSLSCAAEYLRALRSSCQAMQKILQSAWSSGTHTSRCYCVCSFHGTCICTTVQSSLIIIIRTTVLSFINLCFSYEKPSCQFACNQILRQSFSHSLSQLFKVETIPTSLIFIEAIAVC